MPAPAGATRRRSAGRAAGDPGPTGWTSSGTTWLEPIERAVARHRSCLQEPLPDPGPGPAAAEEEAAPAGEAGLAARTRARHAEVHAALGSGLTITEIGRTLTARSRDGPPLRHRRDRRGADRRRPPGPARPARPAPGLAAAAMEGRDPQHRSAARRTARPRLPGQPAHPAPAHRPAAPRHRRSRAPAPGEEGSLLDPHPARRARRR